MTFFKYNIFKDDSYVIPRDEVFHQLFTATKRKDESPEDAANRRPLTNMPEGNVLTVKDKKNNEVEICYWPDHFFEFKENQRKARADSRQRKKEKEAQEAKGSTETKVGFSCKTWVVSYLKIHFCSPRKRTTTLDPRHRVMMKRMPPMMKIPRQSRLRRLRPRPRPHPRIKRRRSLLLRRRRSPLLRKNPSQRRSRNQQRSPSLLLPRSLRLLQRNSRSLSLDLSLQRSARWRILNNNNNLSPKRPRPSLLPQSRNLYLPTLLPEMTTTSSSTVPF